MKKLSIKLLLLIILMIVAGNYKLISADNSLPQEKQNKIKYIFLFIGDGMGENHRKLAEKLFQNEHPGKKLYMNQLPVQGKTITLNSLKQVTDSAAAGTAIACGVKTTNGKVGMDPEGKNVNSIAILAKQKGMKIGIISSTAINDATPASFYAHATARALFKDIVNDMALSGFNFFGGGKLALDKVNPSETDFEQILKTGGYTILNGKAGLQSATSEKCYAQCKNSFVIDSKNADKPSLAEYTVKASEILDNPNGFFIMVEGGKIDHASHYSDSYPMVKELFAFDEAIKAGIDFQQKHPTDTLIVVTSDHETGGIVLPENLESLNPMLIVKQKASYTVIFEELKKISDPENNFDRALNIVKDYLGFDDFTTAEQADLKAIWNEPETRNNFKKFVSQASKFRDLRCGIKWSTGGHSEAPVITSALGNGQELFEGNYENTEIFEKLKQLILR